jgi:hypothetical protein
MASKVPSPLLCLSLPRAAFAVRFGLPDHAAGVLDGVGSFDAWNLRPPCGLEIDVMLVYDALQADGSIGESPQNADVVASADDIDHVLFHLGATGAAAWRNPSAQPAVLRFVVRRSDDNGGEFEVARFTSRCEANAAASALTARGHKQMYWVEPLA